MKFVIGIMCGVVLIVLFLAWHPNSSNPGVSASTSTAQSAPPPTRVDMIKLRSVCGKPGATRTMRQDGKWYRVMTYRLDGDSRVEVTFSSASANGPWAYSSAWHYGGESGILQPASEVLPCIAQAN